MKHLYYLITIIILTSCTTNKDCQNNNPVFTKNAPGSKAYNDELTRQIALKDNDDITYSILNYEEKDGKEFLHIKVEADDLCATAVMVMTNWNKLEDVKRTKGKGYIGAKLENLTFDVLVTADKTELRYNNLDRVTD